MNTGGTVALNKNPLQIGVIAEETNDVDVLYELTCKIIPTNTFSFKKFVGHGSGKLRKKCRAWAENLSQRGCTHLVVMHDRDRDDPLKLRAALEKAVKGLSFQKRVVLIPTEELEAWLLADPEALKNVFNMREPPAAQRRPEMIPSPKEFLENLVSAHSKTQYLNTIHNRRIASSLDLGTLACCPSFEPYPRFLQDTSTSSVKRKR